ncbi:hypothetical protein I7I53_00164 [Histoplasma capsulatum var. duboisii H88]|uniref:Uncharacterized protein n=1 Tax=Ajellomyces capsulatus (strain H88) TaxID=544711 RepID=A0A8A1LME2_AJEC8|nr:hypothetical protein I7I53_00164 [Histoplasma capsulatum var. duboisii H88]
MQISKPYPPRSERRKRNGPPPLRDRPPRLASRNGSSSIRRGRSRKPLPSQRWMRRVCTGLGTQGTRRWWAGRVLAALGGEGVEG